MRTRTVLVALLAVYSVVSTVYFLGHLGSSTGQGVGGQTASTTDLTLPPAPPYREPNQSANQPLLSGNELLARVQIENELRYTDLMSFVCNEQMQRFRGHLDGQNPKQLDTVTTTVSFENGVESYRNILQNNRERTQLSDIPGAWSEGEFGTLLRQTRTLLTTQALASKAATGPNGQPATLFSMEVSGNDSPWQLLVGNQRYRVPFRTDVLVAQNTGRILQINRTSTAMPPDFGISQIEWGVNLKPIPLDGKEWLLPTSGEYSIAYQKSNRREWNLISFADYHHYIASSVMHF